MFNSKPERKQEAAKRHVLKARTFHQASKKEQKLAAESASEAVAARAEQARAAASSVMDKANSATGAAVAAAGPKLAEAAHRASERTEKAQETLVEELLPKLAAAIATAATAATAAKANAAETASKVADTDLSEVKKAAAERRDRASDAYAVLRGDALIKPKRSGRTALVLLGLAAAGAAAYAAWTTSQPKNDPWAVPASDPYGKGLVDTEHIGQKSTGQKLAEAADSLKAKAAGAAEAVQEKATSAADSVQERATSAADSVQEKATSSAGSVQEKAGEARHGAQTSGDRSSTQNDTETRSFAPVTAAGAATGPTDSSGHTGSTTESATLGSAVTAAHNENRGDSWGGAEITTLDELGQASGEPGTEQATEQSDAHDGADRRGDSWTDTENASGESRRTGDDRI